ncbi:MAG: EAL domain-containing protein, partial [Congregibacter sp.]|nr:EAL domain-containing protein [Congregibacter sp.]
LEQAANQIQRWQQQTNSNFRVKVNVSSRHFANLEFVGFIDRLYNTYQLKPGSLCIEITESGLIENLALATRIIEGLAPHQVKLCLDDFGTGYSSLSYLTRFPLDELKIDRSFVLGLSKGEQNVELVRAIIAMAKSLRLEIVVEGVERLEELEFFRDQEVDIIQGFLFSQPVPLTSLRELLKPGHFLRQLERLNQSTSDDAQAMRIEQA